MGIYYYNIYDDLYFLPQYSLLAQVNSSACEQMGLKGCLQEENCFNDILKNIKRTDYPTNLLYKDPRLATHLELLVTYECNLSCLYCYSADKRSALTMNPDVGKKAVDVVIRACLVKNLQLGRKKKIEIHFHGGGEPTCAFNVIKEITEYAIKRCAQLDIVLALGISTNGCMDDGILQWLIKNNFSFHISMDGFKETQNKQRPSLDDIDSFERVASTLDMLQNNGNWFAIRLTVTNQNVSTLPRFIDYIAKRWPKVADIRLAPLQYLKKCELTGITPPSFDEYIKQIEKCHEKACLHKLNITGFARRYDMLFSNNALCSATRFEQLIVDPEGIITTCHESPDENSYIYGKIEDKIEFNIDKINNIKQGLKNNIEVNTRCTDCGFKYLCLGGCKHRRISQSFTFFCQLNKYYFCDAMKRLIYDINLDDSRFKRIVFSEQQRQMSAILQAVYWN